MPNCLKDGWGGRCPTCNGSCVDPVQKTVDDYLLMERKARAWDQLHEGAKKMGALGLLAQMDVLVHPAHNPSTC